MTVGFKEEVGVQVGYSRGLKSFILELQRVLSSFAFGYKRILDAVVKNNLFLNETVID